MARESSPSGASFGFSCSRAICTLLVGSIVTSGCGLAVGARTTNFATLHRHLKPGDTITVVEKNGDAVTGRIDDLPDAQADRVRCVQTPVTCSCMKPRSPRFGAAGGLIGGGLIKRPRAVCGYPRSTSWTRRAWVRVLRRVRLPLFRRPALGWSTNVIQRLGRPELDPGTST